MPPTEAHIPHLEQLFYAYQPGLHWFCLQIVKSSEDADEIVNDAFLVVWERKEELKLDDSLKNYLYTIVKNKSLNFLKKRRLDEVNIDDDFQILSQHHSVIDQIHARETEQLIFALIDRLPSKCRQIFVLSRKENMSNREIAALLEISEKTVENQITIAIRFIKDGLNSRQNSQPDIKIILLPWMITWLMN
ncbi:MAG: RNA polymerase sigma-70 factor [Bacteroidota bacterium]